MSYQTVAVSAIIPVYNGEGTIAAAIDSALALTDECDLEIIAVDDGSTDSTPSILTQYADRIRLIRQARAGRSAALNRGVLESREEYLAFLDADDLWLPGRLRRAIAALESDAGAGLAFSDCLAVDADGNSQPQPFLFTGAPSLDEMYEHLIPIIRTTVTVRRDAFERTGGFDERLSFGEDYCVWLVVRQHYHFAHTPELLAYYRRYSEPPESWRYPLEIRSAFENALVERHGHRANKLVSELRDQWAEKLFTRAMRQIDERRLRLASRSLIEVLRYRLSYLVRGKSAKTLFHRGLRGISKAARSASNSSLGRVKASERAGG
jgi:glycosyltransferase involved in cell wall biosynthesis